MTGIERRHISLAPEGERGEIRHIFASRGFSGEVLERIVAQITSDPDLWVKTMVVGENGLSRLLSISCGLANGRQYGARSTPRGAMKRLSKALANGTSEPWAPSSYRRCNSLTSR